MFGLLGPKGAGKTTLMDIRFRNLLVGLATKRTVILFTHIVEDIGQTCQDLAVMSHGRVIFRGSPAGSTQAAPDNVFETLTCFRCRKTQPQSDCCLPMVPSQKEFNIAWSAQT